MQGAQGTVTSGTIFASRKMPIRDYLLAIAIFVNGAKGHSALQLSRDLVCNYKSAYVLAHKLREAIGADAHEQQASGDVEVDGGYFGGYVKPANLKANRRDRRLGENNLANAASWSSCASATARRCPSLPPSEDAAVPSIRARVTDGSTIMRTKPPIGTNYMPASDEADQPFARLLGWRRLHQSGRKLFQPDTPR